jgi:hypothetical protein
MIKAGVGRSKNPDSFKAGVEAIQEAIKEIKEEKPHLILLTVSKNFDPKKVLEGIANTAPGVPLAGGSPGWGTITHKGIEDEGVIVMALSFKKMRAEIEYAEGIIENSQKAGEILGEKLIKRGTLPRILLIFSAVIGGAPVDPFLLSLKKKLGNAVDLIGGGTGDEMTMESSMYQFYNDKVLTKSVVGVGFWGDFSSSLKAEHGWEPLGLSMKITKSENNLISEINKRPAIEIFKKYFREEEIKDPKFFSGKGEGFLYPLGIISEKEKIVIRQIIGSTQKGELICANSLPKNATVRLMQAQGDKIPETAKKIGNYIVSQLGGKKPQLAFIFDCVTRRALLAPDHQKEIDALRTVIGDKTPVFGYYSYGEICSAKKEKEWFFHNETFTAAVLAE